MGVGVLIAVVIFNIAGTLGMYVFLRIINRLWFFLSIGMNPDGKKLKRIKTRKRDFTRSFYVGLGLSILYLLILTFSKDSIY